MLNTSNITLSEIGEFQHYVMEVPFNVVPERLYTPEDIYDKFDANSPSSFEQCYDTIVYKHMLQQEKLTKNPKEMAARSMHDCQIRNYMHQFLSAYDQRQVIGIMGGHAMKRTDIAYRQTIEVSKRLTEKGYLMISGGGPGAMEATHVGAWMAGRSAQDVNDAIDILSQAPTFEDEGWLQKAFETKEKFPLITDYKSLAIPTWFYGHEPPCAFATHIAKFFDNSIREDEILTVSYGGLIYMPGSAGTIQEIFQEAVQDHYLSLGYASPMVFVGSKFWTEDIPIYPFFKQMTEKGRYKNLLLSLVDETEDIIHSIECFSGK